MKESEGPYMPRHRYGLRYFTGFVLLFLVAHVVHASTDPVLNAKLEQAVAKVRADTSPMGRAEAAEHLAELTHRVKPDSIDDKAVTDMISLLDIPDDSARLWTALALGNLGKALGSAH
jgi:hypothetical protein